MNLLCVNTALKRADIALLYNQKCDSISVDSSAKHSENLLKNIDLILGRNNVSLENIDVLACAIGPGSFTGIRIGVSTLKGFLSVYKDKKIVSVNTLELLAYNYLKENIDKSDCLVLMNALSNKYYVAKYNASMKAIIEPRLVEKDQLKDLIIGNNVVTSEEDKSHFGIDGIILNNENFIELVEIKVGENKFIKNENFSPMYLRLSQAEDDLNKTQKK